MLGKLSRLPPGCREELNRRLTQNQPGKTILAWVNALPELQAIINQHFNGEPVSDQNLSDYRSHAFRKWQLRQDALEFVAEAQADSPSTQQPASEPFVDHLVHWVSLRYAALAHHSNIPEDPESELRQIRQFLADIVSLRRGDLIARRIHVEQQRLALEQSKTKENLETLFWEWTKRPDIQALLYPHRDPDKVRRDVVRMLDRELLGISNHSDHEPEPDPAIMI